MAECEKVCRYIDLPLQHASADVLKRMRRPGNRRTYDTLLARIREPRARRHAADDASSSASPARPTQEFAELEGFVADTGFDHVGVFTYSHEEGTRAFALADDVPAAVEAAAPQRADGAAEEDRRAAPAGADRHARSRSWSTARPPSTSWSCRAGSKGQAPDIDSGRLPDRLRSVGVSAPATSSERGSSARRATTCVAAPSACSCRTPREFRPATGRRIHVGA